MWCVFNTKTDQTIQYFSTYELANAYYDTLLTSGQYSDNDLGITLMD